MQILINAPSQSLQVAATLDTTNEGKAIVPNCSNGIADTFNAPNTMHRIVAYRGHDCPELITPVPHPSDPS